MTQIPEKKLRQSLIKLDKAKIIKKITDYHLDFQKSFLREIIDENFTKDQQKQAEFYELNHDIVDVMRGRIKTIQKLIQQDFLNFDQFSKICQNNFCKKEYKSEEYFGLNDKCKTCGSELLMKKHIESETQ